MPLHFPTGNKGSKSQQHRISSGGGQVSNPSVNKSTTFGLGPGLWRVRDDNHSANLLQNLCSLRENGEFTDITFSSDGEAIMANRVVLAAVSPVMKNVFTKRESLVNAEVLPPDALHQLVEFIYSSSAEINFDVIKKIQKASRVLEMHAIAKMCKNVLESMPAFADVPTKPKRRLAHISSFDQSSIDEGTESPQQTATEFKVPRSGSNAGSCDSMEMPDIIMSGLKRDAKASIKLTFHSRSGTPLSRSSDDLTRMSDASSIGSGDKLESDVENSTPTGDGGKTQRSTSINLPEINIHSPKNSSTDLSLREKRQQEWKMPSKSIDDAMLINPKIEAFFGSKSPIPLSKLLAGSSNPSIPCEDTASLHSSETETAQTTTSNGTWPKRVRTSSPHRRNIPSQWRYTDGEVPQSEPANEETENESGNVSSSKPTRLRRSRDIFTIGFRTKSIPNLMKGLNTLREQNQFCDLTIIVMNARIPCHRVVLAASSRVFRAILKRINSREIVLTKIDEAAIQEMIRFIYTGQCNIDKDNVMGVMRGSRRFQLHFVAKQCASYLDRYSSPFTNFFSPDNVLIAYKIAEAYGFPRLREESKKFAIARFWELTETQSFRELTSIELNRLIANESLRVARTRDCELELQLFRALVQWLTFSPNTRIPHMTSRVMKFVNFSNIKSGVLHRVISKEAVAMQDQETRERILIALRNNTALPKRSASMKLPCRKPGETFYAINSATSEVYSVVTHAHESDNKITNKIYNLTRSGETGNLVTSSPIAWSGHAVTSYNGSLYLAGGRDVRRNKRICSDVYKYDDSGWTQLPNMKVARSHFALVPLDGAIYAIGGLSENLEKQYQPTASSEKFDLDPNRGNNKWKLTPLSLPHASFSHDSTNCNITTSRSALDLLTCQNKEEGSRRKPPGSPLKKKGFRLAPPTNPDGKSPIMPRGSPKQSSVKYRKSSLHAQRSEFDVCIQEVIFVCGGKCKPRQNLMFDATENKFVDKSPLPCPCTRLSLTSSGHHVYLVCDDVMDTSRFRMFDYGTANDQWTEIKIPMTIERFHLPSGNGTVNENKQPRSTSIACVAYSVGIYVAISTDFIIEADIYDVASATWTSHKRTEIKSSIVDIFLCSIACP